MKWFTMVSLLLLGSIAWAQKSEVMNPNQLGKLIPSYVKGYSAKEPHGKSMKIGDLTYSLWEREFTNGDKRITIKLFDYNHATIMYNQGIRIAYQKEPMDSDTLISRALYVEQNVGWETYNSKNKSSQIMLGINDRFMLMIEGSQVSLDELALLLIQIDTSAFPAKG